MGSPGTILRAAAVFFLAAAMPAKARADGNEHEVAAAAFKEGVRLVNVDNCGAAVTAFRESLSHEESIGARLDLADCEEKLGLPSKAWRDFELTERLAAARADPRRRLVLDRLTSLGHKLFVIAVPTIAGLALKIDGIAVEEGVVHGGAVAVEPGAHSVEVAAPGYTSKTQTVAGRPGDLLRLSLEMVPPPPESVPPAPRATPPAPVPPRPDGPPPQRNTLALVIAGSGAIGLTAGAVFGALTFVARGEGVAACKGSYPRCDANSAAAVSSANDRAQTYASVSDVAFAVGGAAAAAGVVWYLVAPSTRRGRTGFRASPVVYAAGAGATVGGTF